ncbi:hypothetical protein ACLK2E_00720 [Escherichia coli]
MAEEKNQISTITATRDADGSFCSVLWPVSFSGRGLAVALGGSWYYPVAGLVMPGVTVMLFREAFCALANAALLERHYDLGRWKLVSTSGR